MLISELQQRPLEVLRMPASVFGSMPSEVPRAMASATPIMEMPSSMLFATLATWPLPVAPQWTMLRPMPLSTGWARSKSAASPPTMKVRVPAAAPPVPPETGASSIGLPCSRAAAATSRALWGSMVELSISSTPGDRLASRPSSPR
ncbi:hypothetical protein D3C72_1864410 [compost metagenome]